MRRWILMLSIVVLAGCSESQQEAGFAGLAGVAENDAEVPFLQPGPGDRLIFPMISARTRNTGSNGGI